MTDPVVRPPVRVGAPRVGPASVVTEVHGRPAIAHTDVAVKAPVQAVGRVDALGTVWWNGSGLPAALPGAKVGDMYLDNLTGVYYRLEPEYFEGWN